MLKALCVVAMASPDCSAVTSALSVSNSRDVTGVVIDFDAMTSDANERETSLVTTSETMTSLMTTAAPFDDCIDVDVRDDDVTSGLGNGGTDAPFSNSFPGIENISFDEKIHDQM